MARTIESIDPGLTPRFLFGFIGGALLGAVALVIILRSGRGMDAVTVRLAGPARVTPASSPDDVRIAVGSAWALGERFEHYDGLARYLRPELGRPIVIVQRRTDGEIEDLLARAEVDAAIVCAGTYLHARTRHVTLDPIAVPVHRGEPRFSSLVVVRRSSEARSMADLRERSFAFTDPISLLGYYAPVAVLIERGEPPGAYFSRTVFTYDFEDSLHAVESGTIDAAAIDSLVLEHESAARPALHGALRVIERSAPFGAGPFVLTSRASEELRVALVDALLQMHEHDGGRAVLEDLGLERLVPPPPGLYDSAGLVVDSVEQHARRLVP